MLESPVNPLTRALASAALGLLILKRRLILKLFGASRVGYEFSKQLNLKRRAKKMRTLSGMRPPRLILAEESHGFALDCRHSNAGVQRRRLLGSRSLLVSKRSYGQVWRGKRANEKFSWSYHHGCPQPVENC